MIEVSDNSTLSTDDIKNAINNKVDQLAQEVQRARDLNTRQQDQAISIAYPAITITGPDSIEFGGYIADKDATFIREATLNNAEKSRLWKINDNYFRMVELLGVYASDDKKKGEYEVRGSAVHVDLKNPPRFTKASEMVELDMQFDSVDDMPKVGDFIEKDGQVYKVLGVIEQQQNADGTVSTKIEGETSHDHAPVYYRADLTAKTSKDNPSFLVGFLHLPGWDTLAPLEKIAIPYVSDIREDRYIRLIRFDTPCLYVFEGMEFLTGDQEEKTDYFVARSDYYDAMAYAAINQQGSQRRDH